MFKSSEMINYVHYHQYIYVFTVIFGKFRVFDFFVTSGVALQDLKYFCCKQFETCQKKYLLREIQPPIYKYSNRLK